MITYHVGDASDPDLEGRIAIAHVLSDTGAYNAGFAATIATRYPRARTRYKSWFAGAGDADLYRRSFHLGAVQWVGVGHHLGPQHPWNHRWVVNMVAQHGLRSKINPHPLDLSALDECLDCLAADITDEVIAMPRIGCGLAGGSWDEVEPLIDAALKDFDVHVYDQPPSGTALTGPSALALASVD